MRFSRIALLAGLAAAWGSASGADLLNIYRDSLQSDSAYQAARAQYQATRERLPQARAGYLPLITGSANVFQNDINREIAPDQRYSTHNYAVTLSQPVFRMQNWIAISQADKLVIQAEATLYGQAQELALRVS
jgi:outer membrane protein